MNSSNDSDPRPWLPTSAELIAAIEKESAKRRANPVAFIEEFAEMYALDSSVDDLDRTWVRLVGEYPWYADDLLHCLDMVLGQPELPLPGLVTDAADVGDEDQGQFSAEQRQALGRRWLQDLRDRFRPVFEELSS